MAKENLTALDLSTRLNCTQAQFSYWMNKKRAISPKKRKEIMQILNCSWSDVFEN